MRKARADRQYEINLSINMDSSGLFDILTDMDRNLLNILLQDKTTGKNIIWATDDYAYMGSSYEKGNEISGALISDANAGMIRPRIYKSREEQQFRIHDKGEVFTPAWVCNSQNNLIDDDWLGYKGAFNVEGEREWKTNRQPVSFPDQDGKRWQDYVCLIRMEITCGEAPYLVSRYDSATGDKIAIEDRIGMLDRKLRVIGENVAPEDEDEWVEWAVKAFKSVYGYEWQGDSLLIARMNLFNTFVEYYRDRFNKLPGANLLEEIADIIAWNIWQMDGLKGVVPYSCTSSTTEQISLFGDKSLVNRCEGCEKNDIFRHNGIYCMIKDWETGETIKYVSLIKRA